MASHTIATTGLSLSGLSFKVFSPSILVLRMRDQELRMPAPTGGWPGFLDRTKTESI